MFSVHDSLPTAGAWDESLKSQNTLGFWDRPLQLTGIQIYAPEKKKRKMLNSVYSSLAARLPQDWCLVRAEFLGISCNIKAKLGNSALRSISGALRRAWLELSRFQGVHKSPAPISATAPQCPEGFEIRAFLAGGFDAFQHPSVMKSKELRKPSICVSCTSLISTIPR